MLLRHSWLDSLNYQRTASIFNILSPHTFLKSSSISIVLYCIYFEKKKKMCLTFLSLNLFCFKNMLREVDEGFRVSSEFPSTDIKENNLKSVFSPGL